VQPIPFNASKICAVALSVPRPSEATQLSRLLEAAMIAAIRRIETMATIQQAIREAASTCRGRNFLSG
jgi:hypothetical protein